MTTITLIPPPNDVTPIVTTVEGYVGDGITAAKGYADTAFSDATGFLDELSSLANQIANVPSVDVILTPVAAAVAPYVSPTAPVEPDGLAITLPAAPGDLVTTAVTPLTIAEPPEFTDVALPLALPAAPSALTTALPTLPTLHDVTMPTMDPLVLPDPPTPLGWTLLAKYGGGAKKYVFVHPAVDVPMMPRDAAGKPAG